MANKNERVLLPQAESAVRRALSVCGYELWSSMEIGVFEGLDGSLIIAYPSSIKTAAE